MEVPSYDEVVERYNIERLKEPGDLTIRNGDIALSPLGDFLLNDEHYHGLFRFVQRWRYAEPTMRVLFADVVEATGRAGSLEDRLDHVFDEGQPVSGPPIRTPEMYARYHALNDEIGGNELSEAMLASSIILHLDVMLSGLCKDLGATDHNLRSMPLLKQGHSARALIWPQRTVLDMLRSGKVRLKLH